MSQEPKELGLSGYPEGTCQHCGSDNLEYEAKAFGCDLDHTIYRCKDCDKLTWKHIYWAQCFETERDGNKVYVGR